MSRTVSIILYYTFVFVIDTTFNLWWLTSTGVLLFHGGVIFGIFSVFVSVRYFTDFTLSAPSCGITLFNNFKLIDEVCLPWILVIAQSFPS